MLAPMGSHTFRTSAPTPRTRRGRRVFAAAGLLFILTICALTVLDVVLRYRQARDDAWRELDAQARVIAEQTARTLQAVDVVLRDLAAESESGRWAGWSAAQLGARLSEKSGGLVQAAGLAVRDADGVLRASSQGAGDASQPAEHIEMLSSTPVLIGTVRRNAAIGLYTFPMSRVLRATDGRVTGMVTAELRVDHFQNFYHDAFANTGTRVSLVHRDTTALARHPPDARLLGQKLPVVAALMAAASSGQTTGRARSPVDGVDRLGDTREMPDYPLVVFTAFDAETVFAPWRDGAMRLAVRTLALAAFAALLLHLGWRQLARLDAAQQSLRESQERFELAVNGANAGIWDLDFATQSMFVSPRAQQVLFGVDDDAPQSDFAYWQPRMQMHAEDEPRMQAAMDRHLRGETPLHTFEFRVQPAAGPHAGQWRWVRHRGLAQRDAAGHPTRMAGSVEDITEQKTAEAQREALERQLRQSQKLEAIGTLAGGIAHDFNNILAAIQGYCDLARRQAPPASPLREHLDDALAATERAKSLVDRILAFSRAGVPQRQPVHVQSVVAETLAGLIPTLPPGLQLAQRLDAGDAAVTGDATQVQQVVLNLCINAVQAMAGDGTLTVMLDLLTTEADTLMATNTLPPGRYLRLEVRDSGSGIPPEALERIFDPFFTTKPVGTGLGLSLVHGIVTDLGGGIAVRSTPGEGSCFTVLLAAPGDTPPPLRAEDSALPLGSGQVVLLLDDEEALLDIGEQTLAALGYEPVPFASAKRALAALRADPARFDLVLTDETMVEMTGTALVAALREVAPKLPVVMMSGFVTPMLRMKAATLGIYAVLAKPVGTAELARTLAGALAKVTDVTRT